LGGDLLVNRLGFGAMRLTGEGIWGWPPDRENAKKVLRRAVELGVNFIDTAAFHWMGLRLRSQRVRGIFELCIPTLGHSLESFRGRTSPPRIHLPARRSRVNSLRFFLAEFLEARIVSECPALAALNRKVS